MPPNAIANPPGLDAITYRTGTWDGFREALVGQLSSGSLAALAGLRARDDDDFAIALIDGFAVMADVLSFYQERFANEAFLRTATERRSVIELAALLGYAPAPGVAADAWLAFTLQDAPGAPAQASLPVTIPVATRAQSVPGPEETAQTFETIGAVDARVEHNALGVQTRAGQEIAFGQTELYLDGTNHRLEAGDAILVVGAERMSFVTGERWDVRVLDAVEPDEGRGHTRVAWLEGLGRSSPHVDPAQDDVEVHVFRRRAALFGHNAPDARLLSTSGTHLSSVADPASGQWNNFEIQGQHVDLDQAYEQVVPGSWIALADDAIDEDETTTLGYVELYRATAVIHRSRSAYGLSSRITRVELDTGEHLDWYGLRTTLVLAESERLPLGERPVVSPLLGDAVELATLAEELARDQAIALTGSRRHVRVRETVGDLVLTLEDGTEVPLAGGDRLALTAAPVRTLGAGTLESLDGDAVAAAIDDDTESLTWAVLDRDGRAGTLAAAGADLELAAAEPEDEAVAEVAVIADAADAVAHDRDRTYLRLAAPLRHVYDRETVAVNANVAPATHGETVSEPLGGGDASQPNQRFALKQVPLTYVRADTPSGRSSTLTVQVGDTLWEERATLYGAGPRDRVHTIETKDDAPATVVFGDGVEGARLPSGDQNVRATYRKGLGLAGNVRAGSLTTLLAGPLGVSGVTNPEAAAGGDDPESLSAARENAPLTVLTLDRAVSLRDYEDFARGYAGVEKAHATWLGTGPSRGVFLTVAGPAGAAIDPSGKTHAGLVEALRSYGDALVRTTVQSYAAATFRLSAGLHVAADAVPDAVVEAVRAELLAAFAFEARGFSQTVSIDEVVAVVHRVSGVVAVDVDELRRSDQGATPAVHPRLFAALPVVGATGVSPAELLTIDPAAVVLGVLP